jgi:hypothetical protein
LPGNDSEEIDKMGNASIFSQAKSQMTFVQHHLTPFHLFSLTRDFKANTGIFFTRFESKYRCFGMTTGQIK